MGSADHLATQTSVPCGGPNCREKAHRLVRCRKCKAVVARCGAHDQNLEQQAREHCK